MSGRFDDLLAKEEDACVKHSDVKEGKKAEKVNIVGVLFFHELTLFLLWNMDK